ncbi:hypothetical protein R3W88_022944 [Solanum pinnatisectum]|uniref:Neprosin PEP catalytic domain-containing protein n=1 Tax=Solanum pinnatisectum TaxID=50273 RepID=A0AAV9LW26_9SOLN|nr:hypothetical protein R3W88_022944 [Solanum pinnatisectum]
MTASLWNPLVKDKQHSACRLKIQKGHNIVQVGWRVDPTLYGDTQTRLYIHFQAGSQQCFNTLCPILLYFASNVEWGGVVYTPPGVPEPLMGSSYLPLGKTGYDAYCRGLTIINDKGETIDVDRVITHVDNPNLYQIMDVPHLKPGKYQHFVLYGGPGE